MSPEELLGEHTAEIAALGGRLRRLMRVLVPEAEERTYPGWHGIGYRHPDAGYLGGIFPTATSVRLLFEHGARLPDPEGVLRGEGSRTRYVEITSWDEAPLRVIEDLVAAAVELRS